MFKEVSKSNRCQVCGKSSWCSYSQCGRFLVCRRFNDGTAKVKLDSNNNEYYVYKNSIGENR